ncbi:hypothetical protein [Stackebrandtia soli]|uniref:hypothetical protein n=1 Tax=Stackebrandtia soli TaxID=1892856 RepID=UPI0039EA4D75
MSEQTTIRPVGRPAIGVEVKSRFNDELLAAVDAVAAASGTSRAEAIRSLVQAGLAAPATELERLFPEYADEAAEVRDYEIWVSIRDLLDQGAPHFGHVEGGTTVRSSRYDMAIEMGAVWARGAWVLYRTVTPAGSTVEQRGDITLAAVEDDAIVDAYRRLLAETTTEYYLPTLGPMWTDVDDNDGRRFGGGGQRDTAVEWDGVIDPATVTGHAPQERAPWDTDTE